ncbi:MAG: cytochrome c, partial [Polyangiaceae bacterium]
PTSATPTSATPTSDAPTSGGQLDGAALYSANCSGCHGDSMKGKAASDIQKAIDGNIGKMGSLKSLTTAQIDAIAATH